MLKTLDIRLFKRVSIRVKEFQKLSSQMQEQKIKVKEQEINYIKTGNGPHPILCFPGALGTIWSDFKPQIEGLNKDKFTIVAWDPPGYGKSIPPNRRFTSNFYERDAEAAAKFMEKLGIKQYSLLGWSDGGISSMILASRYPDHVKSLVVWGSGAYVLPEEIEIYEKLRDTNKWSDKMKEPMIKMYGKDGFQEMWSGWCDALKDILEKGGNVCKHCLVNIKCPTLILHGMKDPMILSVHISYLKDHIKGSKLHIFPEGKHNIHLRYPDEFNGIVTRFMEENVKM